MWAFHMQQYLQLMRHVRDAGALIVAVAGTVFFLVVGIWYFRRTERTFADVI